MEKMSITAYILGSIMLIVSCFTPSVTLTWLFGALAVAFLIVGCILQFNAHRIVQHNYIIHHTGDKPFR